MSLTRIEIAKDFTETPGGRKRIDGPYSGEEFRETFLEKFFLNPDDNEIVTIVFDGVFGFATSFLEESFGGLVRKFGKERVLKTLKFVSNEEPLLIDEVTKYIDEAGD